MDQLKRYCSAKESLDLSKREESSRTREAKARRALAIKTLGKAMQATETDVYETSTGDGTVYVFSKFSNKSRKPSFDEIVAYIESMQSAHSADDVCTQIVTPFQSEGGMSGVCVSKKLKLDDRMSNPDPRSLPSHLVEHVEAVLQADALTSQVRKNMKESRKEATKTAKETKEEAMSVVRESRNGPVSVRGDAGMRFMARYDETVRPPSFTLSDLEATAKRVAAQMEGAPIDSIRATLKEAVKQGFDAEGNTVEKLTYAVAI